MCARGARARQSRKRGLRRRAQRRRAFGGPGRGDARVASKSRCQALYAAAARMMPQLVVTAGTAAALGSFNEGWKREAERRAWRASLFVTATRRRRGPQRLPRSRARVLRSAGGAVLPSRCFARFRAPRWPLRAKTRWLRAATARSRSTPRARRMSSRLRGWRWKRRRLRRRWPLSRRSLSSRGVALGGSFWRQARDGAEAESVHGQRRVHLFGSVPGDQPAARVVAALQAVTHTANAASQKD